MKLFLVLLFAAFAVTANVAVTEEQYMAAMKKVLPTQGSLKKGIEAKDAESVKKDAAVLEAVFKLSEDFWKERKAQDGVDLSIQAKQGAAEIGKLAGAGEWDKIPDAQKKVGATCMACHNAHREKLPEGGYKIK
jgi:cytochrome c556